MAQLASVCSRSKSLVPFLELGQGSLPAPFSWSCFSLQQKARAVWLPMQDTAGYGVANRRAGFGVSWSPVGRGGNCCLMLGQVLNMEWEEDGGEVDPLHRPFPF